MDITSIYENHFRGPTYRTGVAYLRARSKTDFRAPRWAGHESLKKQRKIIAVAAKDDRVIIVAEFIDYGSSTWHHPGEADLRTFCEFAGVPTCYVLNRSFLDADENQWDMVIASWKDAGVTIREAHK